MLKRIVGDELWCITQPDHAVVSGYLAAHWGNDDFACPGHYAPFPDPDRLRAETILAIAEHDNGWGNGKPIRKSTPPTVFLWISPDSNNPTDWSTGV